MRTNSMNRNLGANKVIPVCVILLFGFILTTASELRAQESVDLPSKPESSAATILEDNSTAGPSTSEARLMHLSSLRDP